MDRREIEFLLGMLRSRGLLHGDLLRCVDSRDAVWVFGVETKVACSSG